MLENGDQPPQPQSDPSLVDPALEELAIRNRSIEAVLDPEGTLPSVTFVDRYERDPRLSETSGWDAHNYAVFDADGVEIGFARVGMPFGRSAERGASAAVDKISINEGTDYRGRGFGRRIYLEVLKRLPPGVELECDPTGVTPDAIKMWQWLESKGLASRPAGSGEPVLGPKGVYENLGYKTNLAELTEFVTAE